MLTVHMRPIQAHANMSHQFLINWLLIETNNGDRLFRIKVEKKYVSFKAYRKNCFFLNGNYVCLNEIYLVFYTSK